MQDYSLRKEEHKKNKMSLVGDLTRGELLIPSPEVEYRIFIYGIMEKLELCKITQEDFYQCDLTQQGINVYEELQKEKKKCKI